MNRADFTDLHQQTKNLKKSNVFAWIHVVCDLCLLSGGIVLSLRSSLVIWGLGQVVFFICIWRAFGILHSCAHHAFFKSRKLNDLWGRFFSIIALIPYTSWKDAHLKHHRHPRHRELDPSLCLPSKDKLSPKHKKILDLCWRFHIPIFSFLTIFLKETVQEETKKKDYSLLLVIGGHCLALFALGVSYFHIVFFPYLFYLWTSDFIIIAQHNLFDEIENQQLKDLKNREHDLVTRTISFPDFIGRYLFLNFDLHTLHHMVPNIPHYHLRKITTDQITKVPALSWYRHIRRLPGHIVYLD